MNIQPLYQYTYSVCFKTTPGFHLSVNVAYNTPGSVINRKNLCVTATAEFYLIQVQIHSYPTSALTTLNIAYQYLLVHINNCS